MERDKELTHIHETDCVFVLQEGNRKPSFSEEVNQCLQIFGL